MTNIRNPKRGSQQRNSGHAQHTYAEMNHAHPGDHHQRTHGANPFSHVGNRGACRPSNAFGRQSPHREGRRRSSLPNPLTTSHHVCHCDQRYQAIIREIHREGSILQQKMARLLDGLDRLMPDPAEMEWEGSRSRSPTDFGPTGVFTNENKVGGFEREDVRAGGGEGDAGPGVGFGHHMDGLKGWQANL